MGILAGTINWKTSWSATKDGDKLKRVIENSRTDKYDGLTVYFLAETHRHSFDVTRSKAVYYKFKGKQYEKQVALVIERGLFPGCAAIDNVVYEGLTSFSSADPKRNERTISLLEDHLQEHSPKVIVFFFGEEHLEPLQKELLSETKHDLKIRWISSVSFTTVFPSLKFNEAARFDRSNLDPAGYICYDPDSADYWKLQLLTKGIFGERFTAALYDRNTVEFMTKQRRAFAVYFKDPALHKKIKGWVDSDGAIDHQFTTFDGYNLAVAEIEKM